MIRAGIFIGVDQTGNLQKLNDAAAGATRMHQWAVSQGLTSGDHAVLITDAGGEKVRAEAIYDAIEKLLDGAGVDQLIVYFAGHGVTINRRERWLLTDAPRNPSAAVNVTGSAEAARVCGVRHVVFISDACRVAPEGIQAQNVHGVEIFPNEGTSDKFRPVDQFFACLVGSTAAEIKDPAVAAGGFKALYTEVLLEGLKGLHSEILEKGDDAGDRARYVKPVKLEQYLERVVPERVLQRGLADKVNQNPDAILTAHPYWLARIDHPPPAAEVRRVTRSAPGRLITPVETAQSLTDDMVQSVLTGRSQLSNELARLDASNVPNIEVVAQTAREVATPFGPGHLESQCGLKVRGARVVDARSARVNCRLGQLGDLVWVDIFPEKAVTVLVTFDDGTAALVPAFQDFIAALMFENGELVDITYEISQNTTRWTTSPQIPDEIRRLHAVAAAASRHGRFRVDTESAMTVALRMQDNKGFDPALAVYAAYAYYDLQALERLEVMLRYLRSDLSATLFDVELVARKLVNRQLTVEDRIVPFLPLLGQGWALLGAHRVRLPDTLHGIQSTVKESLWSLYDERGRDVLARVIDTKEVL